MSKRRFKLTLEVEVDLWIDDKVIKAVDDEWRKSFYQLYTPEDIATHITINLMSGYRLTHLDGWADMSDRDAVIGDSEFTAIDVEEIKE